jgi:hypothetical protein
MIQEVGINLNFQPDSYFFKVGYYVWFIKMATITVIPNLDLLLIKRIITNHILDIDNITLKNRIE